MNNLAKESTKTTEALPTLDRGQVNQLRMANKGKFNENSRYVINRNKDSAELQSHSRKRKTCGDDDAKSEPQQEAYTSKRSCTWNHEVVGAETSPEFVNEYNTEDTYQDGQGFYEEPTYTAGAWGEVLGAETSPDFVNEYNTEDAYQGGHGYYEEPTYTAVAWDDQGQMGIPMEGQNVAEDLVPLFLSTYDQTLALSEGFTTPEAVVYARENGYQQTLRYSVYWYRQSTPRFVSPDGNVVEHVVGSDFFHLFEWVQPIANNT